ncbi:hypothetical protein GQ53DRAFT_343698 [Thozetella sp. PMI_491]|nr:hypothetical protein GQ53DRAFT_343698 [Thozetella sp. PMI_491]
MNTIWVGLLCTPLVRPTRDPHATNCPSRGGLSRIDATRPHPWKLVTPLRVPAATNPPHETNDLQVRSGLEMRGGWNQSPATRSMQHPPCETVAASEALPSSSLRGSDSDERLKSRALRKDRNGTEKLGLPVKQITAAAHRNI